MRKSRKKKAPKHRLALPDLELAKSAVLNSLTSTSAKRTYEHAIDEFVRWYCSEPRLAFNRVVVLRFRNNGAMHRRSSICASLPSAGSPTKRPMRGS